MQITWHRMVVLSMEWLVRLRRIVCPFTWICALESIERIKKGLAAEMLRGKTTRQIDLRGLDLTCGVSLSSLQYLCR